MRPRANRRRRTGGRTPRQANWSPPAGSLMLGSRRLHRFDHRLRGVTRRRKRGRAIDHKKSVRRRIGRTSSTATGNAPGSASPMISTGLAFDHSPGAPCRAPPWRLQAQLRELAARSIRSSTASTPAPPPLVTITSLAESTGLQGEVRRFSAAANSSSRSLTARDLRGGARRSTAGSLPASAPYGWQQPSRHARCGPT